MLYISFLLSCLHSVSIARYNINPLGNERCISDWHYSQQMNSLMCTYFLKSVL